MSPIAANPTGWTGRVAVVVTAALIVALAFGAPAVSAQEDAGPPDAGPPEVDLELVSRSPWVAPGGRADFAVRADGPTAETTIDITVHRRLRSVEALEESLEDPVGRRLYRSPRLPFELVPVGADDARIVQLPTAAEGGDPAFVELRDPGVYPVAITLYDAGGSVLDVVRTPLVRLGTDDDPLASRTLALVVDVGTDPTLQPDGSRSIPDPELERLGRLGALLEAHPHLPLTVAAVPDTIEALLASPEPTASAVLAALNVGAGGGQERTAMALPYVPASIAALYEAGLDDLLDDLLGRGHAVLTDQFGEEPSIIVWDPQPDLDPSAANRLLELGYTRALVDPPDTRSSGRDDGDDDARSLIDAGPRPIEGLEPLAGIIVDRPTTAALADDAGDRTDAGHVAMADLLLRDDEGSTVVLRLDDHRPDSVLAQLLALVSDDRAPLTVGGLELVDAAPLLDAEPLPWIPAVAADLAPLAERIDRLRIAIVTYADLLPDESSRADDLRLQVLTSLSATAGADERRAALDAVDAALDATFDDVYLSGQIDLNLTSRQGTLPILVHNDNAFPVDVVVSIRSDRLSFPAGDRFLLTVTEEVQRIDIPVEALATGSVPTFVQLRTPDGRVLLDSRQLNVRSTAISGVGLALSAGALLVLVVWWARNWRRSRDDPAMG